MNEVEDESVLEQISQSEIVSFNVICRLCANPNERIIGIYSEEGISNNLADKMNRYLPVQVCESDYLPLQCCWSCASTVLAWHELYLASAEADRRLREIEDLTVKQTLAENFCDINEPNSPPEEPDMKYLENKELEPETVPKQKVFEKENLSSDTVCSICSMKLSSERYLTIHKLKKHGIGKSKESPMVCEICQTSFKRRCDILRHIQTQHATKSQTKHKRVVEITENHKSKKKLSDEIDAETFTSEVEDDTLNTEIGLACIICNKSYKKKSELNKHLKDKHDQSAPRFRRNKNEIIAEHFCDVCDKGFTRKYDMQKHRKVKHPNIPAVEKEPTQQQNNLQLLRRCKISNVDSKNCYKCESCQRVFRQSYNFIRHQSIHTGVRAYFCHICGKNFRVSSGLYRHITEHHYGVKKYPCDVCGKSFAAKATRDDHKNIHTNHRPFVCDVCGKAFRQKASLHIHKLFHTDNFRFSCNYCGKQYRRASELKIHTWLHTGHKPHQCNLCDARFRLRQDLNRHHKIHNKSNTYVCKECGSSFNEEKYLKNHRKSHEFDSNSSHFVVLP